MSTKAIRTILSVELVYNYLPLRLMVAHHKKLANMDRTILHSYLQVCERSRTKRTRRVKGFSTALMITEATQG